MSIVDNIKAIREEKGLKQIEVATHIGVDKSAYSKIEKGQCALTVEELQKMLTYKKFKNFFQKNILTL